MIPTGLFCLVLTYTIALSFGLKSWIPNTNINNKHNWNFMDLPRRCDEISFDISNDLTVLWSMEDLIVSGLRLPASGTLKFQNDMSIEFKDKAQCPGARVMKYIRDEWKGWLDPFNWESHSNEMWLPHAMRIPCTGEDVKFPTGNNFAVQLPKIKVSVGKIHFGDEEFDGDDWSEFLNTGRGKSMFRSEEIAEEPWLHDVECPVEGSCPCGKTAYVYENRGYKSVPTAVLHQAVCLYAKPKCQPSECYSPIFPEGHCCGVCGTVFQVRDTGRGDQVLNQILDIVKNTKIDSDKNIQYYVGKTTNENIEVVVLAENSGHMSDALTSSALIKDYLIERKFDVVSEKISGPIISGSFFNSPSGVAFGTFLAAILFFALIYFVYVVLPEKNLMKVTKEPFGFARFRNVLQEASSEEKLEIGTEAEEIPSESSQGFHNPTFSDNNVASASGIREENLEGGELQTGQEYNNPTYHEMEKTRELFAGKDTKRETEDIQEFSEIDL